MSRRRRLVLVVVAPLLVASLPLFFLGSLVVMPGRSYRGSPPSLTPAERATATELAATMRRMGRFIGERNREWPERLEEAAADLERGLRGLGYGVRREQVEARAEPVRNVYVERRGEPRPNEVVLLGANRNRFRA